MNNKSIKVLMLAGILLIAPPVFAKKPNSDSKSSRAIDIPCIQSAIDERDSALVNMIDTWSSSTKDALETRRGALKETWSISVYKDRRFAQRKAWSDYGKILQSANNEKTKARARAWKKFDHDRKQCEGAYSPEMKTGSTYDANL